MSDIIREIRCDGRTFLLESIDTRWFLFETIRDGYDLIGCVAEHGDLFFAECFWRPVPGAVEGAATLDAGIARLLELADGPVGALTGARPGRPARS